jgi:penicillin-binding protein 1A
MATAYASIASYGYRLRPTAIKKIKFPDGRVEKGRSLPARFRVKKTRIFDEGAAAEAMQILEQNIQGGTGGKAAIGCPAGGKTGTTDNNTDAWFVGSTPKHTTAVWVGYPNERIFMNTQYFGGPVDGGTFPAAMWGDYMGRIKGNYCEEFRPPKTPFVASPFFGKYAKSGGSLIGAGEPGVDSGAETPEPTEDPGTGGTTPPDDGTDEDNGGGETPDQGDGAFDPDQYEAAPQPPPETVPPPAGDDGGAGAPPG